MKEEASDRRGMCPQSYDRPLKLGEWDCPACGNRNYKGRETCNFRGCPTNPFKRGDWICRTCQMHNYGRNIQCKRCSACRSKW